MTAEWALSDLIEFSEGVEIIGRLGPARVKGVTSDSREIRPGYIYVAVAGQKFDGHQFIQDALRNGAVAIVANRAIDLHDVSLGTIPIILTWNPRAYFAQLAARFYRNAPETIVAVTGTNGKTSIVHYVQSIWAELGVRGASLGTLGVVSPGRVRDGRMTTPDPVNLHAEMADLAAVGITHLAMEASSHGIDQHRLDGVRFKAAAFTNLTHDHLDYHHDMEHYYQAKARLITTLLQPGGTAVINSDRDYGRRLAEEAKARGDIAVWTYGHDGETIRVVDHQSQPMGQSVTVNMMGVERRLDLQVVGAFQAHNICAALGLVKASLPDISVEQLFDLVPSLQAPRGRLQRVAGHPRGAGVYVDYAHTPDALEHILKALRAHTQGRLIVVFGCGGDRDKSKRPVMGRLAAALADMAIVTDDNPRSEDAAGIRREIMAACPNANEIGDRAEAIRFAIGIAKEGDVVVIAGKGHEQGQIAGGIVHPFDDVNVARDAMA